MPEAFALVREVREFFDGPIALSGSISEGSSVLSAQALGADYVTAELTDETNTKRISYYAEKHDVKVGYHGHLQSTDIAWNFALDNSKNNYINSTL